MPKPNKKQTKKDNLYHQSLVNETLCDLGNKIHIFRNLKAFLAEGKADTKSVKMVDQIYQTALDEIFDALSNAGDLQIGNLACNGIAKAMLVRRGFIKKSKALE